MKKIKTLTLAFLSLTSAAMADLPAKFAGQWVFDDEASVALVQTSPKWKESDARFLPEIVKMMSQVKYSLAEGKVIMERGGKANEVAAKVIEQKENTVVFELQPTPKYSFKMTCTLNEKGQLSIRPSNTDDLDYYLWKRGSVSAANAESDAKIATEVLQKALETPAKK